MSVSCNLVVLGGRVSRPPETRELSSGARVLGFDLAAARPDRARESVPVVWTDPPSSAAALDVGVDVLVVGRVRRRFFRVGGATQSRTEVVAEQVVPARAAKRVAACLEAAAAQLHPTAAVR